MCVQNQKHVWHQIMLAHTCKINAPHTHAYPYEVSSMKQASVANPLSFIIYTCKNNLGRMVTDILGHPKQTALVAAFS